MNRNMKKVFVLDTNVLLHNADAITSFSDNVVVLPMTVIEELDKFKSRNDELARNARQVIRSLDKLRSLGHLGEGVSMENNGLLKIFLEKDEAAVEGMDMSVRADTIGKLNRGMPGPAPKVTANRQRMPTSTPRTK